ncbi:hypothetical protein [Dechloromonas denitrificans]|uniref:hypothetical protein n=1 Tax=Dechloromonas denitrificans TaxID=281362 RepID=UPI001CF859D7|nr:hypothetical protein [Dechloromonas denitrificans]UCV03329.1 hypothetical protein KI611_20055 [Dechloromonas denitrificans]
MDVAAWVGATMLFAAAMIWGAALYSMREAETTAQHVDDLRHRFKTFAATQSVAAHAIPSLPDYYQKFPAPDQVSVVLKSVHDAAGKAGFDLTMADYRETPVAGTSLGRYEVSLQVRAAYPQLRRWLAEIMNEWPSLALVECTIKRDSVLAPTIEAQLRLAFYHRSR